MRASWRRSLIGAAAAAAAAGALYYAFRAPPVAVDLATAARGEMRVTVDEEGRTRVKEVYVVSAPLAGRMQRVEMHVGDRVVANETVLAVIQPSDPTFLDVRSRTEAEAAVKAAEAAKALAEADLARARAELEFALADLERAKKLAERETISQRALERAQLDVKTRRAELATAQATVRVKTFELETARARLITPDTAALAEGDGPVCCIEVRAPVNGRVLKVIRESEGVVAAAEPLLEVGDPKDLEIEVELLSQDAVKVAEGAPVLIEQWGGGPTLHGRVRRVEPYGFTKISALGIEEQRAKVIIDFTDPPDMWRRLGHGYRVETRIVVWEGDDVLTVPMGALFRERGAWTVFVAENGRARARTVTVGHTNSQEAEVVDGLREGERVVLHPSDRIADGVRLAERPAS